MHAGQLVHDCMRAYNTVATLLPLLPVPLDAASTSSVKVCTVAPGGTSSLSSKGCPAFSGSGNSEEGRDHVMNGRANSTWGSSAGHEADMQLLQQLPSMLAVRFMSSQPSVHDVPFPINGVLPLHNPPLPLKRLAKRKDMLPSIPYCSLPSQWQRKTNSNIQYKSGCHLLQQACSCCCVLFNSWSHETTEGTKTGEMVGQSSSGAFI